MFLLFAIYYCTMLESEIEKVKALIFEDSKKLEATPTLKEDLRNKYRRILTMITNIDDHVLEESANSTNPAKSKYNKFLNWFCSNSCYIPARVLKTGDKPETHVSLYAEEQFSKLHARLDERFYAQKDNDEAFVKKLNEVLVVDEDIDSLDLEVYLSYLKTFQKKFMEINMN